MVRHSQGITLVELLVVMAIISVMLAFVGPPVSAGLDNLRLTSTSQRMLSAFRQAQTTARTMGQRVYATYDENNLKFFRADHVSQTLTMPSGVRLVVSRRFATVIFLESGRIIGPETLELINNRGRRIRLSIDHASGSVQLEQGS